MAECCQRERWNHTAWIVLHLAAVNWSDPKKRFPYTFDDFHPLRKADETSDPIFARLKQAEFLPEGKREAAIASILRNVHRQSGN